LTVLGASSLEREAYKSRVPVEREGASSREREEYEFRVPVERGSEFTIEGGE
jgi:hypothetical protein